MLDKMEPLPLLLMFFIVSGYSYILQPSLTVMQTAGMDRDQLPEMRSEQLKAVSLFLKERKTVEEQMSEGVSPETNPVRKTVEERRGEDVLIPEKIEKKSEDEITTTGNKEEILARNEEFEKVSVEKLIPQSITVGEETKREGYSAVGTVGSLDTDVERRNNGISLVPKSKIQTNDESRMVKPMLTDKMQEEGKYATDVKFKRTDQLKQTILEKELESELVAGISLHKMTTGDKHEDDKMLTVKQEIVEENKESEERERRVDKRVDIKNTNHNKFVEKEKGDHTGVSISTPQPPVEVGEESVISTTIQISTLSQTQFPPVPTLHAKVSPPSLSVPSPAASVVPAKMRSVSLLEDLLVEVRQGKHLKRNEMEVKVKPHLEDVTVKNILLKPPQKEPQTTHKAQEINTIVQPNKNKPTPRVQGAMPKPKESKFVAKDVKTKEPNPTIKTNENKFSAQVVKLTHKTNVSQPTGKPKTDKLMENGKPNKPTASLQLQNAKTASIQQRKDRGNKNKTVEESEENKRKMNNKTQKPSEKKEVTTPTSIHFPYFMDNYCPPECACYGRVVQCSDKWVDKIPYGIPYNSRYILLMNNHISSIQLDLLSEYVSMEFLALSNNQLTDGAIEGVFEGVLALKRLYLDRNLLESVPTDLPVSLEELRLDNNQLSVISEAAWSRCPSLLILSLSNNSLGNGSASLPNAVLSPLGKLRILNLDYNQLKSVPLDLPLSIEELYLKGNLIEKFHRGVFNGRSELMVLDLSANRLTDTGLLRESLHNATHLESLNLAGNRLKKVPRHLPHSLKTLNLEGNLITSITKADFSTLTNLEHVGLARNKIFRVAPGAFRTLLVLHHLELCHNTLQQVPRQLPEALHSVILTHNKIQSVPHDAFCWGNKSLSLSRLVRVHLEHNLIDMGKLDVHAFRCLRGFQVVHFY